MNVKNAREIETGRGGTKIIRNTLESRKNEGSINLGSSRCANMSAGNAYKCFKIPEAFRDYSRGLTEKIGFSRHDGMRVEKGNGKERGRD